jgi:Rho termination factor, N-terminal domain
MAIGETARLATPRLLLLVELRTCLLNYAPQLRPLIDGEEASVPTTTQLNHDPQNSLLSVVREGQAAAVDMLRAWTDISQQLTRNLGLPMARIEVAGAVDRAFDVAEQTLAAQRQLALTLTGVATRQVATAVERIGGAVEAVDTAVETVQTTGIETSIEELRKRARELEIEGRSAMSKDELVATLRRPAK